MTIAGELINILGFKLEGEANLKKFNKGMDDAESSAKKQAASIKKLGVAAGITTTGMIAMGTAAFKNAAAFERTMARIGITAGASTKEVKEASDTVTRLARDFALPLEQAVGGLDTLTASGLSLNEAMAFLPSVLSTAQAAGAATEDIANTAIKTSSALGIAAGDMQKAFDVMVAGGKAGQFELKDMAQYIPDMANQFANLGYKGEDGLKRLIAILQTLREDTGSASTAAVNATNIFSKMFSKETEKAFSKFGVDIREEMSKAQKAGEDAISAYVRLTQEVLDKNPTAKISDLFADQQFQQGMLSLITSTDRLKEFFDTLNNADVDGSVFRDLNVILEGTQTKIDRMGTSWDMFMKAVGGKLAGPVGSALETATDWVTFDDAIGIGLTKRGMSERDQKIWRARNWFFSEEERGRAAREGGYAPTDENRRDKRNAPRAYEVLGRMPRRPITATPAAGQNAAANPFAAPELMSILAGMDANIQSMAANPGVEASITDARQDNRSFPISVQAPVNVTVNEAQAPGAVGGAISNAIGQAATAQQSRLESEPSQP